MEESVRVVVTGTAWMGRGIGSVTSALEALIGDAKDEILVAAYSIGTGAGSLLDDLERAAGRGRKIVIIVNRFAQQPMEIRIRLVDMIRNHPWCRVFDFSSPDPGENLHAKVIVADRNRALIGSANLSRRGLLLNHELALLVEGATAGEVARAIDLLMSDDRLVRAVPASTPGGPGSQS